MPKVSDINILSITLEIDNKRSLFILLAKDGSINRLGTGSIDNKENDLYIGITKEQLFDHAIIYISDDMLQYMGSYDIPDQKGLPCRLSIGLQFNDGEENGFDFSYGSESEGPADEISELVIAVVQITEPWYQSQKKMISKSDKPL
jgi:hypothetical protein